MYSTRFDNELRYVVTLITNQDSVRVVETIVDTGAKYTCYRASFIDDDLQEDDLETNQSVEIGGFVSGDERINKVRDMKKISYAILSFLLCFFCCLTLNSVAAEVSSSKERKETSEI